MDRQMRQDYKDPFRVAYTQFCMYESRDTRTCGYANHKWSVCNVRESIWSLL